MDQSRILVIDDEPLSAAHAEVRLAWLIEVHKAATEEARAQGVW